MQPLVANKEDRLVVSEPDFKKSGFLHIGGILLMCVVMAFVFVELM